MAFALCACGMKSYPVVKEEHMLSNDGKKIYGVLFRPEGLKKAPVVIISHGFGGNHAPWEYYAENLVPLGYAAYCFDFCGGGNNSLSDGKTTDMSVMTEKSDLEAVIDGLKDVEGLDLGRVTLIGESQGGLVSALVAADRKDIVENLILIYPALCIPDDWVDVFPTTENMPEEMDVWGTKIGHAYVEGLYGLDVYPTITKYEGRVRIFHGDEDNVVPLSYSERAQKEYKDAVLTVMPGQGHGFSPEATEVVISGIKDCLQSKDR